MNRHMSKEQKEKLHKILSLIPLIENLAVNLTSESDNWQIFNYLNEVKQLAREIDWEG